MRLFCSICKDIFIPYSEVHVTNCGHLYHGSCISTWIKHHRTCPQCRANLSQPFRVYFDVDKDNDVDPSTLEHQIEILSDKLREEEKHKKNLEEENKTFEKIMEGMKECAVSLSKKNDVLKTSVKALKEQVTKLTKQNEAITYLENEVETWKKKAFTLEKVEILIKGSVDEVNKMIETTPITGLAVKHLCTYVGILKAQLHKIETKNVMLAKENRDLARTIAEEKKKHSTESEEIIKSLRANNSKLENELFSLTALFRDYKKKHPEKNEGTVSPQHNTTQMQTKRPSFDIDLEFDDEENKSIQLNHTAESDQKINHWEELVSAGPSKNFGLSVKKSRSFYKILHNKDDENVSKCNSDYAFDGLGGRKKLRLGGPTPLEEFLKIKKKKDKKLASTFQHKKIIEYYQADGEINAMKFRNAI